MATERSDEPLAESDGDPIPCVCCQSPTTGTLFASANVYIGIDAGGRPVNQWLKPIPVCERHRYDLSRNMSVLSWCQRDEAWGMKGQPCVTCGALLTVGYHRT
ncbi:MAG: hypothetical protein ABI401_04940 [Candidatus Dormibacter sp.]